MKKITLLVFSSLLLLFPAEAFQSFQPGEITPSVTSLSNPRQSYAVFLPSDYTGSKAHPILFVMDPRGQALLPLERFKDAADSLGYIAISSYNTQSDTDQGVTIEAINTMINDAFQLFSVDTTRFYLAGFSGTARLSWIFGYEIRNYIAGIIGTGAGNNNGFFLADSVAAHGIPFNYYGASGFHDFNYFELLELDPTLTEMEFPHHISFFEGAHRWADREILQDALYWMELMEIKKGTIATDSVLVANLYTDWQAKADSFKELNDHYHLYLHLLSMQRTFSGFEFLDTSFTSSELDALKNRTDLVKLSSDIELSISGFYNYAKLIQDLYHLYDISDTKLTFEKIDKDLDISFLVEQRSVEKDIYKLRSVNVFLELVFTQSSFYQTRKYINKGDFKNAHVMLQVANSIKPENPNLCYQLARVNAQLKKWDEAIENLRCIESQPWFEGFLSSDFLLDGLKKSRAYKRYARDRDQN